MTDFDAIVIGSGAGGLTAAVALQQAGLRTLVLEQHYPPAAGVTASRSEAIASAPACTTSASAGPAAPSAACYEGLGVGRRHRALRAEPRRLDHVLIGDARFDVPKGRERLSADARARFPHEAAGLRGYSRR